MIVDWDKILNDLSVKVRDGIPDLTNEQHLIKLWDVLKEHNWNVESRVELLTMLQEKIGKVYYTGKPPKGAKTQIGPRGGKYYVGDTETGEPAKKGEKADKETDKRAEKSKKLKELISDTGTSTDPKIRIQDKEVLKEFENDTKEVDKEKEELRNMIGSVDTLEGSFQEKALLLTALGHTYGTRSNSGFLKNNLGLADRDQMVRNEENLMELYGDGSPEVVEKGVRQIRKNKVSESFVKDSFNTLPKKLQTYLKAAGNGGKDVGENHFLGYKKEDGTITSDINEAGDSPEVVRGKVPNKARGELAWRMYLEQGGVCGYSGLPLDLEEMDLEHVVGMRNSENGEPGEKETLERENEKNQILTSSRLNQKKSDLSMKEFYEREINPLRDKSKEDFEKLESGKEEAKVLKPQTEQTALRMMDEVSFRKAGGGTITQSEIDALPPDERPELTLSDDGVPKVKSAMISENMTSELLQQEFEMEDKNYSDIKDGLLSEVSDKDDQSKIKKLKSKLGKRIVQALGLPGNLQNENRRTNSISANDDFYRGYAEAVVSLPKDKRQEAVEAWREAIKFGNERDEEGNLKNSKKYGKVQKDEFCKFLRDKGVITDDIVKKYPIWRYKNEKGEKV